MNRKASFNAIATLILNLSEEEQLALVDKADKFKKFASDLVREVVDNIFFTAIDDRDVPAKFADAVAKWRKLASDLGYDGPVVWSVKAGFTLKQHAPAAGPCYEKWDYLQNWKLQNDEPTADSLVFFIPRIVGTSKNANEQKTALAELRRQYNLPTNHLTSFGSAALLAGLILANFKRKGERAPLNCCWVRTDTFHAGGFRLNLGDFDGQGLGCGSDWIWGDDRDDRLGVFPLGVETLGR